MSFNQFQKTELGNIPSHWNVVPLSSCIKTVIDYRGKTPKKLGGDWCESGYRALSAKNIKNGSIVREDTIRFLNQDLYDKWMKEEICRNDVLMTSEAPLGETMFWDSEEKIVLSQRLYGIRPNEEIVYPRYLYMYMNSVVYKAELDSRASGTTVTGIRQTELLKTRVILPSLNEQKSIANILSSLDDKIELNNQMNETLEEMAQTLFKRWFVDFEFPNEEGQPYKSSGGEMVESELGIIPKGWEVKLFGELIQISSGKRPSKKSIEKDAEYRYPLIGASSIMGYVLEPLCDDKILVIGRVGTHGVVQRFCEPVWPSDNTLVIRTHYYEFINQILRKIDYSAINRGSTQPLITQTDIKNKKLILPSKELLNIYEEKCSSIFNMIEHNQLENISLCDLRDTLLPKLMSGEIRVSDLEE